MTYLILKLMELLDEMMSAVIPVDEYGYMYEDFPILNYLETMEHFIMKLNYFLPIKSMLQMTMALLGIHLFMSLVNGMFKIWRAIKW